MSRKEIEYEKSIHGSVFLRLMKYAIPYLPMMVLAFILVLALTGLELLRPALIGRAVDLFTMDGTMDDIKFTAIIYGVALLLSFVFNFLQTWILQLTGQNIIYNIRQELFEHIHKLSLRFFDITPVGIF